MVRRLGLEWTVTWLIAGMGAGSASAQLLPEQEAYCRYLEAKASEESWSVMTPSLISNYFHGGVSNIEGVPPATAWNSDRLRIGLQYDLVQLMAASAHRDLSSAACESFRALSAIELARRYEGIDSQLELIVAERLGARAALRVLEKGHAPLKLAQIKYQKKLVQGGATVSDVVTVNDSVLPVELQIANHNANLERLERSEKESRALQEEDTARPRYSTERDTYLSRFQTTLNEKQLKEMSLRNRLTYLDAFSLNLTGGYQRITGGGFFVPHDGAYAGVELKIDLGAVFSPPGSESLGAYADWLKSRRATSSNPLRLTIPERMGALAAKLAVYERRSTEISELMKIAGVSVSNLESLPISTRLFSMKILADAEAEAARVELAALKKRSTDSEAKARTNEDGGEKSPDSKRLRTTMPNFRYVQPASDPHRAYLRFTYLGEMSQTKALGSGEVRHQLGVMLGHVNQCNLLYVILRLGPSPTIAVQEKRNPGQTTHQECRNRGYRTLRGQQSALPAIQKGATHLMKAEVRKGRIVVSLDGKEVWHGDTLAPLPVGGDIGFRSDNVEVEFSLSETPFPEGK